MREPFETFEGDGHEYLQATGLKATGTKVEDKVIVRPGAKVEGKVTVRLRMINGVQSFKGCELVEYDGLILTFKDVDGVLHTTSFPFVVSAE